MKKIYKLLLLFFLLGCGLNSYAQEIEEEDYTPDLEIFPEVSRAAVAKQWKINVDMVFPNAEAGGHLVVDTPYYLSLDKDQLSMYLPYLTSTEVPESEWKIFKFTTKLTGYSHERRKERYTINFMANGKGESFWFTVHMFKDKNCTILMRLSNGKTSSFCGTFAEK
ncbi:DUF4251 domain-containing protein [uncultured Bacteroides sp.]|uniref:DUF4251 domain-containing protein n=1 Tax=uncultured Bacteroides sp. TaxID=162156 RepID=UPI00263A2338|nr:DUF4251 domain-containing protein [uncultured Bacteroides sp.]